LVAACARVELAGRPRTFISIVLERVIAAVPATPAKMPLPKLKELDNTRRAAERELAALKDHQQRVVELERDVLLGSMAEMMPEALDSLTGQEKNRVYRMLRLEVTLTAEGYAVSGALCTSATPSG
jgi:hypothetical protein